MFPQDLRSRNFLPWESLDWGGNYVADLRDAAPLTLADMGRKKWQPPLPDSSIPDAPDLELGAGPGVGDLAQWRRSDSLDSPLDNPPIPQEMAAPGGNTLMVGEPRPEPAPEPRQGGGFWGGLRRALPRMVEAGLAAATTPNVAGGSIVDVLRGMQVGRDALDARDQRSAAINRQSIADLMKQADLNSQIRLRESQQRMHEAQIKAYEAQANQRVAVKPEDALLGGLVDQYQKETDPAKKQELWRQINQFRGHDSADYQALGNGLVLNKREGTVTDPTDPNKKIGERMKLLGITPDTDLNKLNPRMLEFVLEGKYTPPPERTDTNLNETELALKAVSGDPQAMAAFKLLTQKARSGEGGVDARQRRALVERTEEWAAEQYMKAESDYSKERAKLDAPGSRPGTTKRSGTLSVAVPDTKEEWDRYNAAHQALLRDLTNKKNAIHGRMTLLHSQEPGFTPASPYSEPGAPALGPGGRVDQGGDKKGDKKANTAPATSSQYMSSPGAPPSGARPINRPGALDYFSNRPGTRGLFGR